MHHLRVAESESVFYRLMMSVFAIRVLASLVLAAFGDDVTDRRSVDDMEELKDVKVEF